MSTGVANKIDLRNLGIYSLPNGKRLIAEKVDTSGYNFYFPESWNSSGQAEYGLSSEDGRLLNRGQPTCWNVGHLIDTGQTAPYWKLSRLL